MVQQASAFPVSGNRTGTGAPASTGTTALPHATSRRKDPVLNATTTVQAAQA